MNNKQKAKKLSSGVVVVRHDADKYLYLLLKAYQYWDFPKGIVEEGETPTEAALREVEEETTINDLEFTWGMEYKETGPYRGGKVARYYIGETQRIQIELPVNPDLGVPEHQAYQWVTLEEAYEIVSPRVATILDWADRTINRHILK